MQTPICDFVKKYLNSNPLRMHMPGHKGTNFLGCEKYDLTEIDGADNLYAPEGIIKQSEKNASELFNANTFYSTEGSSLCIKAALFLAIKNFKSNDKNKPIIFAGRNAHKAFISASALLDFDVVWLQDENSETFLSCNISATYLDEVLSKAEKKPAAVYITTPDYLGCMLDVKSIKRICEKYGVLLIVDNAHGAYLNFLQENVHPIALGADICCDSAHKTLPALTGGAYLHVSKSAPESLIMDAKDALSLFGSTSPSYLILQSLDALNQFLASDYKQKLSDTVSKISKLKNKLIKQGYVFYGNEPMKITFCAKKFGYTGNELSALLKSNNVFVEFFDQDYVVLMPTTETTSAQFKRLEKVFSSIKKRPELLNLPPKTYLPKRLLSVRNATLSPCETISINLALGRIIAEVSINCPPAVPIIVSGEIIDDSVIERFNYYNIKDVKVVKK